MNRTPSRSLVALAAMLGLALAACGSDRPRRGGNGNGADSGSHTSVDAGSHASRDAGGGDAGSNACTRGGAKIVSCWAAMDCSRITDATAKTSCEDVKDVVATGPRTMPVPCEGEVLTAAEAINACTLLTTAAADLAIADLATLCRCRE